MANSKNILLLSYVFPPYPGVGGRRWAKFARQLAVLGYEVYVICAENILEENSPWTKDIDHPAIHATRLRALYPAILEKQPKSLLEKTRYRLWTYLFRFFSKGQIFERTLFWKRQLLRSANELITSKEISKVIVTGPPFLLMYYASELKVMHPGLTFIADFRDPWTDNTSFMGYSTMSPDRLRFEQEIETTVLKRSDIVLTVADKISADLRLKIPTAPGKVMTLPNGFDPSEIDVSTPAPATAPHRKFTLVYTGNLYADLRYVLDPLTDYLVNLKKMQPEIFSKLQFRFFGQAAPAFMKTIKDKGLEEIFVFSGWVSREIIGRELDQCDACLLMFTPGHGFAMNTKFFEYLAHRKPILLFSNEGSTAGFIENNRLGFHIGPGNLVSRMDEIINQHFSKGLAIDKTFDINQYSIPVLTQKLIAILNEPPSHD